MNINGTLLTNDEEAVIRLSLRCASKLISQGECLLNQRVAQKYTEVIKGLQELIDQEEPK